MSKPSGETILLLQNYQTDCKRVRKCFLGKRRATIESLAGGPKTCTYDRIYVFVHRSILSYARAVWVSFLDEIDQFGGFALGP